MSTARHTEPHGPVNFLLFHKYEHLYSRPKILSLENINLTPYMSDTQPLDVATASRDQSVWRNLDHNQFRRNVTELQQLSKNVPGDPTVHSRVAWSDERIRRDAPDHVLSFAAEQRLADDFAFIAAADEGVHAVSAVGLEQSLEPSGLVVRLAANDMIPEGVPGTFIAIFELLKECARKGSYVFLGLLISAARLSYIRNIS